MTIHRDHAGDRWVEVEIEVPGSPEQVWAAIATGPGISSWFVPTEFEPGPEGNPLKVTSHFGPGNSMDSVAAVVAWLPPRRFTARSVDLGPEAPAIYTEWGVRAKSGSTCVVRVEHRLGCTSDAFDAQLEGWASGWPWFFQILRLYLLHFAGQPCRACRVMGSATGPVEDAWRSFTRAIGISDAEPGKVCKSPEGMPPLVGTVKKMGDGAHAHGAILRLDEPAAGILSTFALPMGGSIYVVLDFFHYGKMAEAAVEKWEPRWQAWMRERFPMPEGGGDSG